MRQFPRPIKDNGSFYFDVPDSPSRNRNQTIDTTLRYIELNEYDYNQGSFPFEPMWLFCDGFSQTVLFGEQRGTIVHETPLKNIIEADKEACAKNGWKKLPGNVVVQIHV
jgi:hypothetical protein